MSRITIGVEIIFHREKFQKKKRKKTIGFHRLRFCAPLISRSTAIISPKRKRGGVAKDIRTDLRPLGKKEHDNRWCYANLEQPFASLFPLFRSIAAAISSNRAAMNLHFSYFSHNGTKFLPIVCTRRYEGRM